MDLSILAVGFMWKVLGIFWLAVGFILILIVLLQKGKGSGIGGAFGGAGGANSVLGTKTGDFLTWVTIALVILFLFLAVVLGIWGASDQKSIDASTQPAPAAETELPATDAEQATGAVEEIAETVVDTVEDIAETVVETAEAINPIPDANN